MNSGVYIAIVDVYNTTLKSEHGALFLGGWVRESNGWSLVIAKMMTW